MPGTSFAVWAPAAQSVSVVGDLNGWDGRLHPMRALGASGIWELFVPEVGEGTNYKYEITGPDGDRFQKADPYAFQAEHPPKTASIVHDPKHEWRDAEWLEQRHKSTPLGEPMSIYEVHLGSWRLNPLEGNRPLTYLELADELAAYAKDMGFTHLELLPVMHHPFAGSWGYQVTGYYAPSPRFGSPDDFREFVDRLHGHGLGVILDWVPAHFPRDEFALARFDGTALYEHADPRRGAHPDWGTLVFNYGRHEVRNFLVANALFWMREYHVDGIRVDAVASMLYLDYSREEGQWVPNEFGGREDLDAVQFLKELNEVLFAREPGVISAAEESTAWPGVSRPTYLGGLGFGFKWNMGWMHDTLAYFQQRPDLPPLPPPRADVLARLRVHRELHPAALPRRGRARQGLAAQQDAGRRLAEAREPARAVRAACGRTRARSCCSWARSSAQIAEWSEERSLDWHLLENAEHSGIQALVRDLNKRYRDEPALWELDFEGEGFWWLEPNDAESNVVAFGRVSAGGKRVLLFVANLSPVPRGPYRLGLPRPGRWVEAINTDSTYYGGTDTGNYGGIEAEPIPWHNQAFSAEITLPPLGAIWLVPEETTETPRPLKLTA